jgi:hypothetical protein
MVSSSFVDEACGNITSPLSAHFKTTDQPQGAGTSIYMSNVVIKPVGKANETLISLLLIILRAERGVHSCQKLSLLWCYVYAIRKMFETVLVSIVIPF